MEKNWLYIGGALIVLFVIGMTYLARIDATTLTSTEKKFVSYAQEIGLDVEQFQNALTSQETKNAVQDDLTESLELKLSGTPSFFINGERVEFGSEAAIQEEIDKAVALDTIQEVPGDENYKGPGQPKVIITEYSDFECPACATYEPIIKEAVDRNKDNVGIIYKHFPLQMHPYAEPAARASEAAAQQGKFWEMHDILFDKQDDWS